MKCPQCLQDTLSPTYDGLTVSFVLGQPIPRQSSLRLTTLTCTRCAACWYTLPHETAASAYIRICNEEPHPSVQPLVWLCYSFSSSNALSMGLTSLPFWRSR